MQKPKATTSTKLPGTVFMSEEHKEMVRATWVIPKQKPVDLGEMIFVRFLEKYPHNKKKFSAFKNIPVAELKGHPAVRFHGARIMKVFQSAVDALDSNDAVGHMEHIWSKVAVLHSHHDRQKESFHELRLVILEVLTKRCSLNKEQQEAWNVLFDAVYGIVFRKLDEIYAH